MFCFPLAARFLHTHSRILAIFSAASCWRWAMQWVEAKWAHLSPIVQIHLYNFVLLIMKEAPSVLLRYVEWFPASYRSFSVYCQQRILEIKFRVLSFTENPRKCLKTPEKILKNRKPPLKIADTLVYEKIFTCFGTKLTQFCSNLVVGRI